jgi:ABC-type lipoprotein release transport system permease subunit
MILFARLIKESARFAFVSIVANKLRTILTLLGITIGIFSIILVFSVLDGLESAGKKQHTIAWRKRNIHSKVALGF